jgi:hypothetical protein
VAHFVACFWHGYTINLTILGIAFHNKDKMNTWLSYKGLEDASDLSRYNYSFYWAITTMVTVGYGDITA